MSSILVEDEEYEDGEMVEEEEQEQQRELLQQNRQQKQISTRHGVEKGGDGGRRGGREQQYNQSDEADRRRREVRLKTKGRGFRSAYESEEQAADRYAGKAGEFESLDTSEKGSIQKSVEGYILIVTNLNPETNEDDLHDSFADYGTITSIHLNLDRRTGYVKGYAFIEYAEEKEALDAVKGVNGTEIAERKVNVEFAIKRPPKAQM